MSTIPFAVVVNPVGEPLQPHAPRAKPVGGPLQPHTPRAKPDPDSSREFSIEHLYQHRTDADACAERYNSQLNRTAIVMALAPPLKVVRSTDTWVAADYAARQLSVIEDAGVQARGAPIRQAMPVQRGVPQFRSGGSGGAR